MDIDSDLIKEKFPARLRMLRKRWRMTSWALSECCGFYGDLVSRYERGLRFPSLRSLIKIALFFHVSIDYLVGLED